MMNDIYSTITNKLIKTKRCRNFAEQGEDKASKVSAHNGILDDALKYVAHVMVDTV